jgi:dihydrofolate synthase/folylpolyglutamate synthase
VCAPQQPGALQVIEDVCEDRHAELILVGRDWLWQKLAGDLTGQRLRVWERADGHAAAEFEDLQIPLLGDHQLLNTTVAVALIETLLRSGLDIPDAAMRQGLATVRWPGRLEVLRQRPLLVADGAHNPDSVAKLTSALTQWLPHDRLVLIFGASKDKDIEAMLGTLLPVSDVIITTRARHPRAATPHALAQKVACRLRPGQVLAVSESVPGAVEQALAWAGPTDLVCGTGSLFVAGEVREALLETLPADDWAHEAEPVPDPY